MVTGIDSLTRIRDLGIAEISLLSEDTVRNLAKSLNVAIQ